MALRAHAQQGPATSSPASSPATTATAAAAPGPSPTAGPRALPVRLRPPLSVKETLDQVTRVAAQVPRTPSGQPEGVTVEEMAAVIRNCYAYLVYRDDLHTSLANYTWVVLDDSKVQNEPGRVDTDVSTFSPPERRISAIGLECLEGDVYVHRMRVYDENKLLRAEFDFTTNPRLLRHNLPRREVFHLWRRSTISRIEVTYSRASIGGDTPRVRLYGGITDRVEHVKTAIYHLENAERYLRARKWADATESLKDADEAIRKYMEQNRE